MVHAATDAPADSRKSRLSIGLLISDLRWRSFLERFLVLIDTTNEQKEASLCEIRSGAVSRTNSG
jgi:hypothetical protein